MDRFCDQFLSRAAFAGKQDRAVGRTDHFDHLEQFLHLVALSDEVAHPMDLPELSAQIRVLFTKATALESAENHKFQLLDEILGFEDVIECAHLERLNR